MKKDINTELQRISKLTHRRTGYNLNHITLECRDNSDYTHDFF